MGDIFSDTFNEAIANETLKAVLKENPGLAKTHSADDTVVRFASPERIKAADASMKQQGAKGLGGLEYWPKDETGTPGYAHPSPGKTALEIYSDDLKANPMKLKNAIYGDLMHGMTKDPTWSTLREEFIKSYTPQENDRIAKKQSWWEDANGSGGNSSNAAHDAYIRGWLNEPEIARKGHEKSGGTMYSPRQIEILNRMGNYLKTGK